MMVRPKINPKVKKARLEAARMEARKLNKKLPRPYVYAYATEAGKVSVYYEPPGKPKVRLHSAYPSPEFDVELAAAKRGQPLQMVQAKEAPAQPRTSITDFTLRWACADYRANDASFRQMSARDQRNRINVLDSICSEPIFPGSPLMFGDMPLSEFNGESVLILMKRKLRWVTSVDEITGDPREVQTNFSAANTRHKFISAVLSHLVHNHTRLVGGRNWARDIKPFKPENEDGHRTPSLEEIHLFQSVFVQGTKERLLFDLAYFTTQRRADLPRLGRQFLEKDKRGNDRLVFVQHKLRNKKPVRAYVPIFPELQQSLHEARRSGILGGLLYLVHDKRSQTDPDRAYSEGSLGNMMQDAIKKVMAETGLEEPFSLHGLRKAGVCRLIMHGLSVHQIMAITGHRTPKEIDRYGRDYMRSVASEQGYQSYVEWRARNEGHLSQDLEIPDGEIEHA